MRRLAERRLRSLIRNILLESEEEESFFSEQDYTDRALGMKRFKITQIMKPFIKYYSGKKNYWLPPENGSKFPKVYPFSRGDLKKIIAGIINLYMLDDEEFGLALGNQTLFKYKDDVRSNYGQFTLDKLENVIYEWLTGNDPFRTWGLDHSSDWKRWDQPIPESEGQKALRNKDYNRPEPEPSYNTTQLDIMGQVYSNYRNVRFNNNPKHYTEIASPNQMVAELQRRIEKIVDMRKRDNRLYSVDKAFHDKSGSPIKLEDLVPDGNYVGREMFETQEQFERLGDYLNDEFKSKYDHEFEEARGLHLYMGQERYKKGVAEAHKIAMEKATQYIEDYAESLGLSKRRPTWWNKK